MTGDNRKNIKIDPELFEKLKADKGAHKSWPQYLRDECLSDNEWSEKAIRNIARYEAKKAIDDKTPETPRQP